MPVAPSHSSRVQVPPGPKADGPGRGGQPPALPQPVFTWQEIRHIVVELEFQVFKCYWRF